MTIEKIYNMVAVNSYTTEDNLTIILDDINVYILDAVATLIYNSCTGLSLDEIISKIQGECINLPDLQTLRNDITEILLEMIEKKLVKVS